MKKLALCASCFNHYRIRTQYIMRYFSQNGYDCIYVTSDYDHIKKRAFVSDVPNAEQIHVLPYNKNISPQRLLSNGQFALELYKKVNELKPDIIYAEIPPNSVVQQMARYKKRRPETFLMLDIFDLWPETFPSVRAKKLLAAPFGIWRALRDGSLNAADAVTLECAMFADILGDRLSGIKTVSLPLCRAQMPDVGDGRPENDGISLCYLGTINNIIDIEQIAALAGELNRLRPTTLHIIGDGESRERFIKQVKAAGAAVEFHGLIYGDEEKRRIFRMCDFGVNIMRESVCVGLTMKSLDYLAGGLPLVNSIGGDTAELVVSYGLGVNINRSDPEATAKRIAGVTRTENNEMRKRALEIFKSRFSEEAFMAHLSGIFN